MVKEMCLYSVHREEVRLAVPQYHQNEILTANSDIIAVVKILIAPRRVGEGSLLVIKHAGIGKNVSDDYPMIQVTSTRIAISESYQQLGALVSSVTEPA